MLKIIKNPDIKKYNEVTTAVKKNDGYCPCMVFKNENTKCMCVAFKENFKAGKVGPCHCGRYVIVNEVEKESVVSDSLDLLAKQHDGTIKEVKIVTFGDGIVPFRKTKGAAGFDCYANADVVIKPGERKLVPLGFAIQLPENYCAYITPRSGLSKSGIDVAIGLIDSDFRGEVSANVINNRANHMDFDNEGDAVDFSTFKIQKGDRICQIVIKELPQIYFNLVDELDPTERGTGGFGHTGVR